MTLRLPARKLAEDYRWRSWTKAGDVTFESVSIPLDRREGDVVMIKGDRFLRIYLRLGHRNSQLDPQSGDSALQLDLRQAPIEDSERLDVFILSDSPREWLWHRHDERWREELTREQALKPKTSPFQSWQLAGVPMARAAHSIKRPPLDATDRLTEDYATLRMREVEALLKEHRPDIDIERFKHAPQGFLESATPLSYNKRLSDLPFKVQQFLGLRDASGRPTHPVDPAERGAK